MNPPMNSKLRDSLDEILEEYGYAIVNHPEASRASHIRTYKQAIRQAVAEEMLELIGDDENAQAYHITSVGDKRNELRAELRQKIKQWQGGEDGQN